MGAFLLLAIFVTSSWLLVTPAGAQWLLSTLSRISSERIQFSGVHGTISNLHAESINFTSEDLQVTIRDFVLDWQPKKLFSGQLKIQQLLARAIDIRSLPSAEPPPPLNLPDDLRLPLSITIEQLRIAALNVFSKTTEGSETLDFSVSDVSAQLQSDGQQHKLTVLQMNSDYGALTASARLNGNKPFAVHAQAKITNWPNQSASKIQTTVAGNLTNLAVKIIARGGPLNGTGNIKLRPFASLPISAMHLSLQGLNPRDFSADAPDADFAIQTSMQAKSANKLIGNITINNNNPATLDQGGLPLHGVNSKITFSTGFLQLDALSIHLADNGLINGNLSWQLEQSSGSGTLTVSQLNPLALDKRLQAAKINGTVQLDGNAKMQRGIITLKDESLTLDANIVHTNQSINLEKLQLRRQQSAFSGQGKLHLVGNQSFDFTGELTQFNLADFIQAPDSHLNLTLELTGNLSPQITTSTNFKFANSKLATQPVNGNGTIELNYPDQVKGNIALEIGANSLYAHGKLGQPGDNMHVAITAPALHQLEAGIAGAIDLAANIGDRFASPVIDFELTGKELVLPGKHKLNDIVAHGHLHDEEISLMLNATDFRNEEKQQLQRLAMSISGQKSFHQFQATAQITDETTFNLQTEGKLTTISQQDPALQWIGELSHLSATGSLPVKLKKPAKLELSQKRIFLGTTDLSIADGHLSIDNVLWSPQQLHTQGKFTGVSLRPGGLPEQNQQSLQLGGEWNVSASRNINGYLQVSREKGDWFLPGDIPLALGLQTLHFAAKTANNQLEGVLSIKGTRIGTTNANIAVPLTLSGSGWTVLPDAQLNGQINSSLSDISWIGQFIDQNLESGGSLALQANLTGTYASPEVNGTMNGQNLRLALLDQGLRLQDGRLVARFDKEQLRFETLKFTAPEKQVPGEFLAATMKLEEDLENFDHATTVFKPQPQTGTLEISGFIGLTGNESKLKIILDQLPLAHDTNYWILTSGYTHIRFKEGLLALDGNINADAGIISQPPTNHPKLPDDVIIGDQTPPPDQTLQLQLDVTLDLGEHFYIQASGLNGRLDGRLRITTTEQAKLFVTGTINTRNAHFDAYGQSLKVKRGIVQFNGSLDDPGLNILAIRENIPVEAGVEVLGTVLRPRIRLVSTPNMPDAEKLSWVVFGRPLESGAGIDTSLLLAAADSILGGQSGGITEQLKQTLGIDELSFKQAADSNGSPLAGQIGTIGKRLSSRAYLSYERGLTAASMGITKLTYSLTPTVRVVTQAGTDSAIDIFYTFQFD